MDGVLIIDKPRGWTAFDVVAQVRKLSRVRRVGHGGTLDPAATGVLPIGLGFATRLLDYAIEAPKSYRARIVLGVATDTYDAEGAVTFRGDYSHLTRADVETALERFEGVLEQLPPLYSAVKVEGRPLYRYAREGQPVERRPRRVTVYRLTPEGFTPPDLWVSLDCSKGTYVRSIAHDLGELLGCGAHLGALVRTRVGRFTLEDAVDMETVRAAAREGAWVDLLRASDAFLLDWYAAVLGARTLGALRQGQTVRLYPGRPPGSGTQPLRTPCRAYSLDGEFVGILRYQAPPGFWRPDKVFPAPSSLLP